MSSLFLGIDLGTSQVKALIWEAVSEPETGNGTRAEGFAPVPSKASGSGLNAAYGPNRANPGSNPAEGGENPAAPVLTAAGREENSAALALNAAACSRVSCAGGEADAARLPAAGSGRSVPQTGRVAARAAAPYAENSEKGWQSALLGAVASLPRELVARCRAMGLSSQVGTYLTGEAAPLVVSWREQAGARECESLRAAFPVKTFLDAIGMPHPAIASYPIPRLLWLNGRCGRETPVCQPKDALCRFLTGRLRSDPWSWRGLSDPRTREYSPFFLRYLGRSAETLPPLGAPAECVGGLLPAVAARMGLAAGMPVYCGCNDFFAALLGMGLGRKPGAMFDITGTSEHLGVFQKEVRPDTPLVSCPFPSTEDPLFSAPGLALQYGVTASSGPSLAFAAGFADLRAPDPLPLAGRLRRRPPVFLPYLGGERAPLFNPNARGEFFGLSADCTHEDMAYAILEGVAFSLRHIRDTMEGDDPSGSAGDASACVPLLVSGGAARNPLLNRLKATILDRPVFTLSEPDASALGAALLAAVGEGVYQTPGEAQSALPAALPAALPEKACRAVLEARYDVYRRLSGSLGPLWERFCGIPSP